MERRTKREKKKETQKEHVLELWTYNTRVKQEEVKSRKVSRSKLIKIKEKKTRGSKAECEGKK